MKRSVRQTNRGAGKAKRENGPRVPAGGPVARPAGAGKAPYLLPVRMVLYTLVFATGYGVFFKEVFNTTGYFSDFPDHVKAIARFRDPTLHIAHPMFHFCAYWFGTLTTLDFPTSAVVVAALFLTLAVVLVDRILSGLAAGACSGGPIVALTLALSWVSAIYLPFWCKYPCLGQSSPNLWHSPTLLAVKPFALLCFYGIVRFIEDEEMQRRPWVYGAAGLATLGSLLAKPNFFITFMPAVGIYLLLRHLRRLDLYWKTALIFLPSFGFVLWQFLSTFNLGGGPPTAERDRIFFDFLGVWHLYTPSVFISVMLGIAFPLAVLACRWRAALRDPYCLMGWLLMGVALAQACLLAEKVKYYHMNFGWGYTIALSIVFINAAAELCRWMAEPRRRDWKAVGGMALCGALFALHLASGIYYFGRVVTGQGHY